MQIFERFRRRWLERIGPWMLTLVLLYLFAIILLGLNNFNIRYQESLRQERFQTYLQDVNSFKLHTDGLERQFDQEMEAIKNLDHRVEFIQNQKAILHSKKL